MTVEPEAEAGFSADPDRYERGRPSYPAEAVSAVLEWLRWRPDATVLEVGAGTGKLTRLLVERGVDVLAIEPVAAMRDRLSALVPAARTREGTAEATGLSEDAVDGAVAAQAFHWFDGAGALDEFRRVLRPGGRLALLWNVRDERLAWTAALTSVLDSCGGTAPRFRSGAWRTAFTDDAPFVHERTVTVEHGHAGDVAMHRDRLLSTSFIAALDEDRRAEVDARLTPILERAADAEGRLTMPYRSEVHLFAPRDPG